ncbi:MAG: class I SAM-dependent methyltransferase [Actinomycetota bacterium]
MIDFERRRLRSRIEAALLDAGDDPASPVGRFKAAAIGDLRGRIVELGPGTGVNLQHYTPGVSLVAIEPNPIMRTRLGAAAAQVAPALDLDVRDLRGEAIDLAYESVDAVVGTLLLCGVDDPRQVLHEVRRVLRPGGTYVFVEHVVAPAGTITRRIQRVVRRPHHWMFNGCRTDHDARTLLESFDWGSLEMEPIDLGASAAWVRHQLIGIATR